MVGGWVAAYAVIVYIWCGGCACDAAAADAASEQCGGGGSDDDACQMRDKYVKSRMR